MWLWSKMSNHRRCRRTQLPRPKGQPHPERPVRHPRSNRLQLRPRLRLHHHRRLHQLQHPLLHPELGQAGLPEPRL